MSKSSFLSRYRGQLRVTRSWIEFRLAFYVGILCLKMTALLMYEPAFISGQFNKVLCWSVSFHMQSPNHQLS